MDTTDTKKIALELIQEHFKFQTHTIGFEADEMSIHTMTERARQCALITAKKVLESTPSYCYWDTYDDEESSAITVWKEVKNWIESLSFHEITSHINKTF